MSETITVERAEAGDAARVRAVRLRALDDAPDAFWMTAAQERDQAPGTWRARLADPLGATFLAVHSGAMPSPREHITEHELAREP